MRRTTPKPFIQPLIICIFASLSCLFLLNYPCFAKDFSSSAAQKMRGMTQQMLDSFSQNYIEIHDPTECISTGGVGSDTCFKVDSNIDVYSSWYPEGCLSDCISGSYAHNAYDDANPFLRGDTQTDADFGDMQYIYAENYDIDYETWPTKYTPNGGNSTQKYYWIVLPTEAYSNGAGETYVATFENLSEPVYFITYDTHQCGHQSEDYCGQASANPDGVEIGDQFFGAFTNNGGNYTKAAEIAGKLTSFCRINGKGEVTASANSSNGTVVGGGSSESSAMPPSGDEVTWIGDSYSVEARSIIGAKLSGISFGGTVETSSSYIQSDKGVSDRYGGGDSNPPALTILKRIVDEGNLKPYLVMAVGTNAGWTDDEVNQFKTIISSNPDTKVVFVTAKAKAHLASDDNGTNQRLKELADSDNNYFLADWAAVYDASYYAENDTHPTANGGYEKWVDTIVSALTSAASSDCSSGEGNQTIVDTALKLAWDDNSHYSVTKPEFAEAQAELGDVGLNPLDCGIYVSAVIRYAGIDPDYPKSYTMNLLEHMASSDLWEEIDNNYNEDNLQPGDVFVNHNYATNGGHIFIYLGDGRIAQANLNTYTGKATESDLVYFTDSRGDYRIFRAKNNSIKSDLCNYCAVEESNTTGDPLSDDQADKLANNYNNNTDNWDQRAGKNLFCQGGECASKYANCSLFSAFFVEMFTDIGENQSWSGMYGGNVVNKLSEYGFRTGSEPEAFSVFSCGATNWGHTGVVVRVDGDTITTVEAGYPSQIAQRNINSFNTCSWGGGSTMSYAYLNDRLDYSKLMDFISK